MARYEYSEGSSNKFWEITFKGKSFTTTYGKIGSKGQSKTKDFASAAAAKKAGEKLIEQKTKKGYALAGGGGDEDAGGKGTPGARYFEFSEGASNKFWEVSVDGKTVITRHGKIGTDGRTTKKDLASAGAAKKERDKLIGQKTKKGYIERGAGGDAIINASNPKLEAAIDADPDDEEAFAVLADWLQEQGDPRGEVISLSLSGKKKRAEALIKKNAAHFLGELEEHQVVRDKGYNNSRSSLRTPSEEKEWQKTHEQAFLWRHGYIHRLRLSHDGYSESWDGNTADVLEEVLSHPSGRFVVEFAFQSDGENDDNLQGIIDVLGKKAPGTTRKITFGDNIDQISWHHTGNLSKLWKGVPNLRVLEIETGDFEVGKMVAPALERAIFITGGLSPSCGRNIAKAKMPNIRHLEIYYGDPNYGGDCTIKDVKPLLARTDLKHLEVLGIKNAMFADDIAKALDGAPVLKTVKKLDLSLGAMTDKGAEALVKAKKSLAHLEILDVSGNFLTKDGVKALAGVAKKVISNGQNEPWDWDGEPQYYVSVSE